LADCKISDNRFIEKRCGNRKHQSIITASASTKTQTSCSYHLKLTKKIFLSYRFHFWSDTSLDRKKMQMVGNAT
jgi:hypothetical protein